MRKPNLKNLKVDEKATKKTRSQNRKQKAVKITINIDSESLRKLRALSSQIGTPYQRLLNRLVQEGLKGKDAAETRLDRLERELDKVKRRIAT